MSGREDFGDSDVAKLPWVDLPDYAIYQTLRLNCLTAGHAELWNSVVPKLSFHTNSSALVTGSGIVHAPDIWSEETPIRAELFRRNAMIELDVLVAMTFGLSLEQLIEIYEIYFPVLQKKERNTVFDVAGNIAWISAKGSNNVGILDERGVKWSRLKWRQFLEENRDEVTCEFVDDTMPGGPRTVTRRFVGPFTHCDRIEDYRRAWAHFERLKSEEAA